MGEATHRKMEAEREIRIALGHLEAAAGIMAGLSILGASESQIDAQENVQKMVDDFKEWLNEESPFC
jgi:hypothetical protein